MEKPAIVVELEARAITSTNFRCIANSTEVAKMVSWYEQMTGMEGDWSGVGPVTHPTNGVQTFTSRAMVPPPGYTFKEYR